VLAIAEVIIQLALEGAFDHHLGQFPQEAALAGELQPTGAGPLGKLAQQLLISRRQLRLLLVLALRHVSHWCLLHLRSYTVEITVPNDHPNLRGGGSRLSSRGRSPSHPLGWDLCQGSGSSSGCSRSR